MMHAYNKDKTRSIIQKRSTLKLGFSWFHICGVMLVFLF